MAMETEHGTRDKGQRGWIEREYSDYLVVYDIRTRYDKTSQDKTKQDKTKNESFCLVLFGKWHWQMDKAKGRNHYLKLFGEIK